MRSVTHAAHPAAADTSRTPVCASFVRTGALRLDRRSAPSAGLAHPAVHGECTGDATHGAARAVAQIGPQQTTRHRDQRVGLFVGDATDGRARVDATGEADLALVHVPDTGTDVLVEQGIGELGHRIQGSQATDTLVGVRVLIAQVRPEMVNAWPGAHPHRGRRETHRGPAVDVDDDARQVRRLPPALTGGIQVPAAGHTHVSVEHQSLARNERGGACPAPRPR